MTTSRDGAFLYVADHLNNKIRQINVATREVTTLAGSGVRGSTDATGTAASSSQPSRVTTSPAGAPRPVAHRNRQHEKKDGRANRHRHRIASRICQYVHPSV